MSAADRPQSPAVTFAERFGANLQLVRDREQMSQETLGQRAGLHRTAVGQIERGERVARSDTLVKLAGALDASPLDFLAGLTWRPPEMAIGAMDVAAMDSERIEFDPGSER